MIKKFRMKVDSTLEAKAKAGTIVFDFMKCDYGLASDDTRAFGVAHRSVTLNPEGGYPSFTVAERDIEEIKE